MSGFRALFLIIMILGNGFIVLHGYNLLIDQLQVRLDYANDTNYTSNILGCNTYRCPDAELNSSLNEIYSRQRAAINRRVPQ